MNRVLALTQEFHFFSDVEEAVQKKSEVEILTFSNSLELINHFLKNYAQLVILDIDILGNEILKMIHVLRSIHRGAKIVLILSSENMSICSSALTAGVLSYQVKPVSVKNAADLIISVIQVSINHN